MTECKTLFDEAFQTLQQQRCARAARPAHALALEAQARLRERLADIKQPHALMTSCLALHSVNHIDKELAAIYDALAPNGLFLGVLAGGQTLHELRSCLIESETALTGGANPRIAPMLDIETLSKLMLAAGFALPVLDHERMTLVYKDLYALMHDLRACGCTNSLSQRSRPFTSRSLFEKAQTLYAKKFPEEKGGIAVTVDLIFLHGWKEGG